MVSSNKIKSRLKNKKIDHLTCNECLTKNHHENKFCTDCGAVFCPTCNNSNPIYANFCFECGFSFNELTHVNIKKGKYLFDAENYTDALKNYQNVIKRDPSNYNAFYYAGKSLYHLGELDKALKYYDNVLEKIPNNIKFLVAKGDVLEDLEMYEETVDCYRRILIICKARYKKPTIPPESDKIGLNHVKKDLKSLNELEYKTKYKIYKNLRLMLHKTNNYSYIEKFVQKYGTTYNKEDITNLVKLITNKGFYITETEIKIILPYESYWQDYLQFKAKMNYNYPQNTSDYFNNLLDIYGNHFQDKKPHFNLLLNENGINISDTEFLQMANQLKKQRELEIFEKNLNKNELISIYDIDRLEGYEFELFLEVLFEKMGYNTERTKFSGDQGADLIIRKFGETTVVQAKNYSNKVTNKAVQEVVASINHYNANRGMVVTNNEFTQSAIDLARSNNVELVDRSRLEQLLKNNHIGKDEIQI